MHNARPNVERKSVNRCNMGGCFWPKMGVVAVEKPTYMKHLIDIPPVDSEENR